MAYSVPDLPYDYDALEPHIDEQTMRVHHDKHHQAYVDKANAALEGTEWADARRRGRPAKPRPAARRHPHRGPNNAGGHSNHSFFWEIMSPDGGGEPEGDLRRGDRRGVRLASTRSRTSSRPPASNRFGSGWAWLVHDGSGLAVVSTANQDSPISDGQTPLLGRRRLGARLLPEVPEPAPGLHRCLVERRRLVGGREPALRRRRLSGGHEGHRALGEGGDRQARVDARVGRDGRRRRRPAGSRSRRRGCRESTTPLCGVGADHRAAEDVGGGRDVERRLREPALRDAAGAVREPARGPLGGGDVGRVGALGVLLGLQPHAAAETRRRSAAGASRRRATA